MSFFSGICVLCSQHHRRQHAVCEFCCSLLIRLGSCCQRCARPLVEASTMLCGQCCIENPMVDRVITAYRYEEPLRTLLHQLKYHQGLHLRSTLTTLMLEAPFDRQDTDCLMPVPMHRERLRHRGFNQAAVLAKTLGRKLRLPYVTTGCRKIINSPPQAGLDSQQRRHNLKGAFVADPLPYERITIIDDLYTTGSTAGEIAKILKAQGVRQVDVWCCARA